MKRQIVACCALLLASLALAAEPKLSVLLLGGSPQRNPVNTTEKNLATEWSIKDGETKNVRWSAQLGTRGYTSPVIAQGKVLVGTNNVNPRNAKVKGDRAILMCFDEATGKFLWQLDHEMPDREVVREAAQDGLCSTPAIDGNLIYYVTPACAAVCADLNGKLIWQLDMMKDLKVFPCYISICSPLVVGDLMFIATGNGRDAEHMLPSPTAPSFVAVNKKTGKLAWQNADPGTNIMEGQWSNPVYTEVGGRPQVIFGGGDGWLYAFEPKTGKLLWKFDCNPKGAEFKPGGRGTKGYLVATPVVADGRLYVGVGSNPEDGAGVGHLWCVDLTKSGDISAELGDNPMGKPAKGKPNPNSGAVWHYGGPLMNKAGRNFVFGRTMSSCAVYDGLVYAAELDGFLHCLDAKTGEKVWIEDLKASVWGSPFVADGKVYMGTDDGEVHVFAQGKVLKRLAKNEMERPIKGTPVACNGVLYVMTDNMLYAIAGK